MANTKVKERITLAGAQVVRQLLKKCNTLLPRETKIFVNKPLYYTNQRVCFVDTHHRIENVSDNGRVFVLLKNNYKGEPEIKLIMFNETVISVGEQTILNAYHPLSPFLVKKQYSLMKEQDIYISVTNFGADLKSNTSNRKILKSCVDDYVPPHLLAIKIKPSFGTTVWNFSNMSICYIGSLYCSKRLSVFLNKAIYKEQQSEPN